MKITKTQLRRIIKEEITEAVDPGAIDQLGRQMRTATGQDTPQPSPHRSYPQIQKFLDMRNAAKSDYDYEAMHQLVKTNEKYFRNFIKEIMGHLQ